MRRSGTGGPQEAARSAGPPRQEKWAAGKRRNGFAQDNPPGGGGGGKGYEARQESLGIGGISAGPRWRAAHLSGSLWKRLVDTIPAAGPALPDPRRFPAAILPARAWTRAISRPSPALSPAPPRRFVPDKGRAKGGPDTGRRPYSPRPAVRVHLRADPGKPARPRRFRCPPKQLAESIDKKREEIANVVTRSPGRPFFSPKGTLGATALWFTTRKMPETT